MSTVKVEIKKCSKCGDEYPRTAEFFRRHVQMKDGLYPQCKVCTSSEKRLWYNRLITGCSNRYRKGAVNEFDITVKFLKGLALKQNNKCHWLGIPLDLTCKDKLRSPSVDRLDNDRGYTKDNVVLTSRFANLGRHTSTTTEFNEFLCRYVDLENEILK